MKHDKHGEGREERAGRERVKTRKGEEKEKEEKKAGRRE